MTKTHKKKALAAGSADKAKKIKSDKKDALAPRFSARDSKQSRMVMLLKRPEGTTTEELVTATGWQQHSVRGAMSGALKKRLGLAITSDVKEHGRVYRITGSVSRS